MMDRDNCCDDCMNCRFKECFGVLPNQPSKKGKQGEM